MLRQHLRLCELVRWSMEGKAQLSWSWWCDLDLACTEAKLEQGRGDQCLGFGKLEPVISTMGGNGLKTQTLAPHIKDYTDGNRTRISSPTLSLVQVISEFSGFSLSSLLPQIAKLDSCWDYPRTLILWRHLLIYYPLQPCSSQESCRLKRNCYRRTQGHRWGKHHL